MYVWAIRVKLRKELSYLDSFTIILFCPFEACSMIEDLLNRVEALENRTPPPPPTTAPAPPTTMPAECKSYQILADASRHVNHGASPLLCDNHLTPNWYRFQGAAGVKMPTSCTQTFKCGTHATGWLSGGHPSVEDGKVTRKVCFSWSNCCTWSIDIQVINCGDFYLYYIDGTPREHQCHLRYCGTD